MCARYRIAGALFSDSFFCFSHLSAQSFVGLVLFFVDLIRTNRVVNKRNKAFCRNEHLFRIEFGFTSTFPVMSLPNFRQKNPLAEWLLLLLMLRFSINSINVQFLGFGFALSSCVLCISSNDYVFHCFYKWTKSNRNYNGSSDYWLCFANVKRRMDFISKQFALFSMRPYLLSIIVFSVFFACTFFWCSPTANRFHPFHFSNDLVTEHRMCFHIRSTVRPLSASDRIDWYVYVCGRSSMQEEFSIKKRENF